VGMAVPDGHSVARAVPGPPRAAAGEPAPAPATRRRAAHPPASRCALARSAVLGCGAPAVRRLAPAPAAGATADGAPLARAGLAPLLVVALPPADGAATAARGSAGPDPPPLGREPPVGHRAYPRRTAQARHRRQQRLHPPLPLASRAAATEPDLGHVPAHPRARPLGSRSVHRADDYLQDAVRAVLHRPQPPRAGARGGDGTSHRHLGVAAGHRGDTLGPPTYVPDPGPRPSVRRRLRVTRQGHGDRHAAHAVPRAQGERSRRAGGAHPPERVPGPRAHPQRAALAQRSYRVRGLLQHRAASSQPGAGAAAPHGAQPGHARRGAVAAGFRRAPPRLPTSGV
ncbi:MAG: hypothetical protein AVDCRST_MAG77-4619, partial [uncultured Chloroflexi bacterium]